YDFSTDAFDGRLTTKNVAGVSFRYVHASARESYNSGVIAADRRDISRPARPNDIVASPFDTLPLGQQALGWENDVRSNSSDAGLFLLSDISWDHGLDLTLGGRYDAYTVHARDLGVLPFEPGSGHGGKGSLTYSASLSYKTDVGLVPYITNAKSTDMEIGQASEVRTSLLAAHDWLSTSFLNEAGVKFSFFDNHLVGALDWYRQERTQLQQSLGSVSVLGTRSKGEEAELRAVLNQNFSLTLVASLQHTMVKGPDTSLQYIPARTAGVSPQQGFGGTYLTFNFSSLVPGNYENTLVPHAVISPYLTYTADDGSWGLTGGGRYVSHTAQTVPNPIIFPAYTVLNLSGFLRYGDWQAEVNVDNLGNERYFTPDADTYANLGALPGIGRTWRITLKREF
ncbi:MAG TPA: TonB-dependent receptor, partial [Rhizomicrobium sp.]|nr:TonB-dependent receptor [Rhizomicrobium sp.]